MQCALCGSIQVRPAAIGSIGRFLFCLPCTRELRDLCGLSEEAFVQSLSRSKNWIASGGKSAATWEKTFGASSLGEIFLAIATCSDRWRR